MSKTIKINPDLFNLNNKKTKKKKEKLSQNIPIISPNILKNKLLKRIKEHKNRAVNININKESLTHNLNNNLTSSFNLNNDNLEIKNNKDEFSESIDYLQTLTQQKLLKEEEDRKLILKKKFEKKTLKNYSNLNSNLQSNIHLELPDELKEQSFELDVANNTNLNNLDTVPYGVLKGGVKPTYRNWIKTKKNYEVNNPNSSLIIDKNKEVLEREKRLNNLREKLKNAQQPQPSNIYNYNTLPISQNESEQSYISQKNLSSISPNLIDNSNNLINQNIIAKKQILQKTIRRKYNLGKSVINKNVGVLIKDNNTRKLIINAHKDLKKKNINDIKNILREQNLIKIGSNAPNDVIRQIYESAMLTGEVKNDNSDIILHNLQNSKD